MSNISIDQAAGPNRAQRRKLGLKRPPLGASAAHCHVEVKRVAEGMAHVLFDEMMSKDAIWREFRAQHEGLTKTQMEDKFVAKLWPQLLDQARATLAGMLRSGAYSDEQKEEIMDILVKDQSLVRGRKNPAQVLGSI